MCVWGGVEKWPSPSLGGRGSPLTKWSESLHRKNLNEEPERTPSLSLSLLLYLSLLPPSLSSSLLSHDAADYSIDLFKGPALYDHEFYCADAVRVLHIYSATSPPPPPLHPPPPRLPVPHTLPRWPPRLMRHRSALLLSGRGAAQSRPLWVHFESPELQNCI